jgi:hypothetical protein
MLAQNAAVVSLKVKDRYALTQTVNTRPDLAQPYPPKVDAGALSSPM